MTNEIKRNTPDEDSCQGMIESVLAYNWNGTDKGTILLDKELSSDPSYLQKYVDKLGKLVVAIFIQETIDKIDHIERNSGTGWEGGTYNSIIWKEVNNG